MESLLVRIITRSLFKTSKYWMSVIWYYIVKGNWIGSPHMSKPYPCLEKLMCIIMSYVNLYNILINKSEEFYITINIISEKLYSFKIKNSLF